MAPITEEKFREELETMLQNEMISKGLSPIDQDILNRIDKLELKDIDFKSIDLDDPDTQHGIIQLFESNLSKSVDEIARALEGGLKAISDEKKQKIGTAPLNDVEKTADLQASGPPNPIAPTPVLQEQIDDRKEFSDAPSETSLAPENEMAEEELSDAPSEASLASENEMAEEELSDALSETSRVPNSSETPSISNSAKTAGSQVSDPPNPITPTPVLQEQIDDRKEFSDAPSETSLVPENEMAEEELSDAPSEASLASENEMAEEEFFGAPSEASLASENEMAEEELSDALSETSRVPNSSETPSIPNSAKTAGSQVSDPPNPITPTPVLQEQIIDIEKVSDMAPMTEEEFRKGIAEIIKSANSKLNADDITSKVKLTGTDFSKIDLQDKDVTRALVNVVTRVPHPKWNLSMDLSIALTVLATKHAQKSSPDDDIKEFSDAPSEASLAPENEMAEEEFLGAPSKASRAPDSSKTPSIPNSAKAVDSQASGPPNLITPTPTSREQIVDIDNHTKVSDMAPITEEKFKEELEIMLQNDIRNKGFSPIDQDILNRIDKLELKDIDFEIIDLDDADTKRDVIRSFEDNMDKGVDEIARALEGGLKAISDEKKQKIGKAPLNDVEKGAGSKASGPPKASPSGKNSYNFYGPGTAKKGYPYPGSIPRVNSNPITPTPAFQEQIIDIEKVSDMAPITEEKFKEELEIMLQNDIRNKGFSPIDQDILNRIDKLELKDIDFEIIDLDDADTKRDVIRSFEDNMDKGADEIARALEGGLKAISDKKKTERTEFGNSIANILEKMAKSSKGEKKELLNKIRDTVDQMNIDELNLVLNSQGLKKAVNKREFMEVIEKGLENLKSEDVTPKIIENALKSVNDKALSNNINKGPLDKLGDNFKALSIDKKIGIVAAGVVVTAIFSPVIVLATLIALVSIGMRYVGIGIGKAGEKIKEGAEVIKEKSVEAAKRVKSAAKDAMDKLPTLQAKESNFDGFNRELIQAIDEVVEAGRSIDPDDKEVFYDTMAKLSNMRTIVKMLQNKEQQSAIKELVKDKGFSEENMERLMRKGRGTSEDDYKVLYDLMAELRPKIMAIGGGEIDKVKQKVDEKVNEMKPSSQLDNPKVVGQEKGGPAMGG